MRSLAVIVAVVATIFAAGCGGNTSEKESTTPTTSVSATTKAPQTGTGTITKAPATQAPGTAPAAGPVAPANPAPAAPSPGPGFNTDFGGTCEGQEVCPPAGPVRCWS